MNATLHRHKQFYDMPPPRRSPPLLYDLCLKSISQILLTTANVIHENHEKNARVIKAARQFLSYNLPLSLQYDLMITAETMVENDKDETPLNHKWINLLELFDPKRVFKDTVDLLKVGRRIAFNVEDCDKLYNLLIWSSPKNLTHFMIEVSSAALTRSKLPNILARAHNLTKVILHRGATNHILRILGVHCPQLTYLDVSHSTEVTFQGLRNLLLKRPSRLGYEDKTRCASSINEIITKATSINQTEMLFVVDILKQSYFWVDRIIRLNCQQPQDYEVVFDPVTLTCDDACLLSEESKDVIFTLASHVISELFRSRFRMDSYLTRYRDAEKLRILLKHSIHLSYLIIYGGQVTYLHLHTRGGPLEAISMIDVNRLAQHFPNLREFAGGVFGNWNDNGTFLPQLTSCTLDVLLSSTAFSFLYNAPSLRSFDMFVFFPSVLGLLSFKDEDLVRCVLHNQGLRENLTNLQLHHVDLTVASLVILTKHCTNLKNIGRVTTWPAVSRQELDDFIVHLENISNACEVQ